MSWKRTLNLRASAATTIACAAFFLISSNQTNAQSNLWTDLGLGTHGTNGVPVLEASNPRYGERLNIRLSQAARGQRVYFVMGSARIDAPILSGILVPTPEVFVDTRVDVISGRATLNFQVPALCANAAVFVQALIVDPATPSGIAFSNAIGTVFRRRVPSDFNGDGLSDIVVGAPNENVNGVPDAGAAFIVYGGGALPNQRITQGGSLNGTVEGTPNTNDRFGPRWQRVTSTRMATRISRWVCRARTA